VLRQGIRREHVLPVIAFCIVSDVLLIEAAVMGVGVALDRWPGPGACCPVGRRPVRDRLRSHRGLAGMARRRPT